jgi:hypothetical protein
MMELALPCCLLYIWDTTMERIIIRGSAGGIDISDNDPCSMTLSVIYANLSDDTSGQ